MNRYSVILAVAVLGLITAGATAQSIPVEAPTEDVTTTAIERTTSAGAIEAYRETGLFAVAPQVDDLATTVAPAVAFDAAKMMAVEDVRPGMKGYGLSVFSGLEPEQFEAEVVGVRHGMMAGTDIIMARLTSPHLVDIGVIAGMSGSPVYLEGKLIGAVAYGFLNVDDPLAGITPIKDMLAVYNSTPIVAALEANDSADAGGLAPFDAYVALKQHPTVENLQRLALAGQSWKPLQVRASDFGAGMADKFNLPHEFTLQPLSSPVVLTSQNPLTSKLAASVFGGMDILNAGQEVQAVSTQGASGLVLNSPGGPVNNLEEFAGKISGGYALSVPFIEGDLNMAVVGTVTLREGERLIAFGHPMFHHGTVFAPMAAARVNALIRNRDKPFKLGESVGHVGMVRQDRQPGIGGLFGQTARMFPVKTVIKDPEYLEQREFNYRVWNDRRMTPGLVMTTLMESLGAAARSGGESAALYNYSLRLDDGTSITAESYSSDTGGTMMAVFGAMADTGMLMNNPFKRVGLEDLQFEMQVVDRLRQAGVESAAMDKAAFRPGETATVDWVLRPFREEPIRMSYSFAVPAELPDGEYDLVVSGATARQKLETRRHPGGQKVHNFNDLVRLVQQNYADNRVYVSLVDKDTGVSVQGSEMPKLPGSVINLIQGTVNEEYFAPVRGNFIVDADVVTAFEIGGEVTVKLKVERSLGQ